MNGYEMTPEILAYLEWELRPRSMVCHWCGLAEIASQKRLEADGWLLSKLELCPKCYEQYEIKRASEMATRVVREMEKRSDQPMRTQVAGVHQFVLDPSPFKKEKRYSHAG